MFRMSLAAAAGGLAFPAAGQADRYQMLKLIGVAYAISEICPQLKIDEQQVDLKLALVPGVTLAEMQAELPVHIEVARRMSRNQQPGLVCEMGSYVFGPSGAGEHAGPKP